MVGQIPAFLNVVIESRVEWKAIGYFRLMN
jgi:hypothetical protein